MTSKTFTSGTVIDKDWLNDVNTKTYADTSNTVAYTPSGTGSVVTTVQQQLRNIQGWDLNLADAPYYLNGNGVTDNYTKLLQAITDNPGKTLFLPDPAVAYVLGTGTITLPQGTRLIGQTRWGTKILHSFNGDMFILGPSAGLDNLYLEGQGATYTGRAMVYNGTDGAQGVRGVKAINFNGNVQEFAVAAGSQSVTSDCSFSQYSAATGSGKYAVVISPTQQLSAVPRKFSFIETNGTPAFDFGGCNDTFITSSFLADLKYTADSRGVLITACRIANQTALTVNGHNNTITGCDINPQITIAASADNIAIGLNSYNSLPIIDNSANARNLLESWMQSYVPSLTSGGTAPSLGNGTITGTYVRGGATTTITGELVLGTTTTLGTGGLSISLPMTKQTADVFVGGTVYMNRGGTIYSGFMQIAGSAATASLLRDTTGSVTFNSPGVFATGDIIRWSATFRN
jgi:hypothetical protein